MWWQWTYVLRSSDRSCFLNTELDHKVNWIILNPALTSYQSQLHRLSSALPSCVSPSWRSCCRCDDRLKPRESVFIPDTQAQAQPHPPPLMRVGLLCRPSVTPSFLRPINSILNTFHFLKVLNSLFCKKSFEENNESNNETKIVIF